jgi:crotonobetainyl-CoA:carnitine CoA-transferase CaiB-like acyl-CoA transferase
VELVADAHVVISGLRPGAMASLGLDPEALRAINPALVTVTHDAYGWGGPWAGRRGFDSLVQTGRSHRALWADTRPPGHPPEPVVQLLLTAVRSPRNGYRIAGGTSARSSTISADRGG